MSATANTTTHLPNTTPTKATPTKATPANTALITYQLGELCELGRKLDDAVARQVEFGEVCQDKGLDRNGRQADVNE
eukprot:1460138-Rhodomonas_salina.1